MSKAENYEFFNIPKEYELDDYNEAIDYIIKKYSKINELIAIYNWGITSIPGVSDIDIVFVFKGYSNTALPFSERSFYFLNAKTRYLVRHPFVFIDEDSFQNIKYIYQNTDFELLYGKNIKIKDLSFNDHYYSGIALLNDIIIRHYPHDFLEQLINKSVNVRDTLLRLNSLKYSVKILEGITKKRNSKWETKLKLIEELRTKWFKKENFDLLVLLNEDAVKITMEIIEKFRLFLIKKDLIRVHSSHNVVYNGIKNKSLFIKNWNKNEAFREMSKIVKDRQTFYSILPIELTAQLIEYSKYDGIISNYIRKNITNGVDYQLKYENILEQRIKILNKQAELAFKLKHSDFVAFFDFGYRNKSGINNWILNLLDKARF